MNTAPKPGETAPKSFLHKVREEIKVVSLVTLIFAIYFVMLMVLKRLVLAQYEIEFRGLSAALIGALIVAKVVVILEHVSLGQWLRRRPVIVDVVLRTLLYTVGVAVVLLLEKAFESRHEHGGLGAALPAIFSSRDVHHVWASTICVGFGLFLFNAFAKVNGALGHGGLSRLFFKTRLEEIENPPERKHLQTQSVSCPGSE